MSRIEELEKRLGADPNSRIFVQLAEEYRKAGLLEQAIEVCENGLQKHPQYPSARVALGRALLEAQSFDRASEEFETVLQQVPDNILANKFLGETYEKLGRLEEALQKYEIAHTLAPEDPDLEERINAVEKVMREGGPAAAAAPPPEVARAAPPSPTPGGPASGAAPPAPPFEPAAIPPQEELEPTLFDGPSPVASEPPHAAASEPEPAGRSLEDDLAPIPLVEVDGPMELEDRFAAPTSDAAPPTHAAPPPATPPAAPAPPPAPEPEAVFEAEFEPEPVVLAPEPVPPPPPPPPAPPAPPTQAATAPSPPAPAPTRAPVTPPPPAPAPTPMQPDARATSQEMETRTMAELYASQGHLDQAIEVYRKLLEKSPDSMEYRTRLDELTMLLQATQVKTPPAPQRQGRDEVSLDAADETDRQTIQALEGWLEAIRKSKDA